MPNGEYIYTSPFKFEDRVLIDNDTSIRAFVQAVIFRSRGCEVEVSWVHNGQVVYATVIEERLTHAEET